MGFSEDLINNKNAGYSSSPNSAAQQILNVIGQVPAEVQKRQEKVQKDETERVKLFIALREAGYSEEDATSRVNRAHRSTAFVEKIFGIGNDNAFQPPTEDATALAKKKTSAELEKTTAETAKIKAETTNITPGAVGAAIPEGFVRVQGKVVKDPTYKRQLTPQERSTKLQDEIDKKELSSMATNLPKLDQAVQAVGQLKEQFKKAAKPRSVGKGDVIGGLKARVAGPFKAAGAAVGANPELNRYKANRDGFSGLIAKGGFGEAGMLTQQDIERIVKILPDEGSTEQEADIAFQEIEKVLGAARQRFEQKKQEYMGRTGAVDEEATAPEEEDFSVLWT